MLQLGFIHMELNDAKEMIASFEALVTRFPASAAAAQAWYGIGRGCFEQKQFEKAATALRLGPSYRAALTDLLGWLDSEEVPF